ncbi:MAG: heme exporter protein CcmB [Pseudoxanthomonas sp.]|nr:heme exporter protein CcmB [Pseudoxanthomonas sp.]
MRALFALLLRDLRLASRRRFDLLQPLFFALLVCLLVALAVGPEPALLARLAPAVNWIALLLALLLALDTLFRPDAEDGSLEQMMVAPAPLPVLAVARVTAFWATAALPLILAAPLFAVMLRLPATDLPLLMLTQLLATPTLAWIGAICAALTVHAGRGGALLALLLLPLAVPVLILAVGTLDAGRQGLPVLPPLLLLGAGLVAACSAGPFVCAAALRLGLR